MTKEDVEVVWRGLIKHSHDLNRREYVFNMRRRMNPHHPQEDIDKETANFEREQMSEWAFIKSVYINHREYLMSSRNGDQERINIVEAMEQILAEDLEKIVFNNVDE